jgi:uncharacterized membrane protein
LKSRDIALGAVLAALYAVTVTVLAPISFLAVQVRVADALLPLSIIFGWPAIIGITLGTFIANVQSPLGPIDIVGGTLANLLATYMAWKIGSRQFKGRWLVASVTQTLVVTVIVGSYISILLGLPLLEVLLLVLLGSVIAINLLGYAILRGIAARFRSPGPQEPTSS